MNAQPTGDIGVAKVAEPIGEPARARMLGRRQMQAQFGLKI
jgi:hypothetical protein